VPRREGDERIVPPRTVIVATSMNGDEIAVEIHDAGGVALELGLPRSAGPVDSGGCSAE